MTLLRTMNIRRLRSLVWLGTVAIMTLAGWKFTEILKAAKGGDFDSESVPNFTALINLGQSSRSTRWRSL